MVRILISLWYNQTFNPMRFVLIALSIFFYVPTSFSQKVFSVEYANQSDIKVFVVDYQNQADLLVYKVGYSNQAGKNNGEWYFTEYANQSEKKIYFVDYSNQADLLIFFVEYGNQAGWRKKDKLHLLY